MVDFTIARSSSSLSARSAASARSSIVMMQILPHRDATVLETAMKRFAVLATGPRASTDEFEPLRAAGLDLVIGRPLDAPARRPWGEADLVEAARAADVVLASHLELISRPVL